MKNKEIWRTYPLQKDHESNYRIEVSNFGNLKTYNTLYPDGKLISGSMQGGYRILHSKLKKKWSEKDIEKIELLNNQITEYNDQIKQLIGKSKEVEKLKTLRQERDNLIQKRKRTNHRITKKNTINFALLYHKAVAEVFLEKPKSKKHIFIIHKDFDKLNNNVENLQWATQEELTARTNLHPRVILKKFNDQFREKTVNVRKSKLNEMEVLRIKQRLKKGDTLRALSRRFNVSEMQIHRIKTGENWSHVKLIEEIIKEKRQAT